jgi:coatomer subunit beta
LQAASKKAVKVQADDPINFSQLINRADMGPGENLFEATLSQALGMSSKKDADPIGSSKLSKVSRPCKQS